jgi:uracil-DNA glycosylase family 4
MVKGFYRGEKTEVAECESCDLYGTCKHGEFSVEGNGNKKILIVSEYPSKKEDDLEESYCGQTYGYLRDALKLVGVDLVEDCWYTHGIRCKPPKEKGKVVIPANAYKFCREKLHNTIEELKPKSIITLGAEALKVLIGHKTSGRANFAPFSKWTGWEIPDQDFEIYLYPLHSPLHILRNYDHPIIERKFLEGLKQATKIKSFYKADYSSDVTVILEEDEAIECLTNLLKKHTLAFDYETTSIKSNRQESKILCVSFSDGFHSWAFPIFDTIPFHKALMKVLKSVRIKKIAANMYFEYVWTKSRLNYEVRNLYFDTVLAAHVLDNRDGITGLKLNTYFRLGVLGYDSEVDDYMRRTKEGEDKKSGNRLNCLDEVSMDKLAYYCALDSLFTYKIYEQQVIEMADMGVEGGYKLLHDSTLALADVHLNGLKINEGTLNKNIAKLDDMISALHEEIVADERLQLWDKDTPFNYNSSQQMAHMLFDILGYTPTKYTAKEQLSTDKESLEAIPETFVQRYLKMKKLEKLKTTYLLATKREIVDGCVRPFISLNGVKSFRASSNSPNYQNLPSHDTFAREMVLSAIEPQHDFIVEIDEKSLEVMIGACYHKSEQMLKFLNDESTDMHRTVACKLFGLSNESLVTKKMRGIGKLANFSIFYGAGALHLATTIWEKKLTKKLKQHFKTIGVKNFNQFQIHCKKFMEWYFNDLFPEYAAYKKSNLEFYHKHGYTQYKLGLRSNAIMTPNQAGNYQIQGSASTVVLYALTRINEYIKKHHLKSRPVLYIHDSLEFDVVSSEWPELKPVIHYWMTKGLQDTFDWIIAPLGLEAVYHYNNFADCDKEEKWGMYSGNLTVKDFE